MLPEYQHFTSFFGDETPLPEVTGWLLCLLAGLGFSFFTALVVWLDTKYGGTVLTSEAFNTAGRSIKTGLTAAVIVSQWTWAATLLQSSNVAWQYGVSGPFWYASGASIQVLLFGVLAIEVKRKAPNCHTVCELVDARWGKTAHITFLIFSFTASIIVSAMLLLGGAATMTALTGMNVYWASFLIPWGVMFYTISGGLKATFLAGYIHTAVIFVILVVFVFSVYVKFYSSDVIHDMLTTTTEYSDAECEALFAASDGTTFFEKGKYACGAVKDNEEGSYLTMMSLQGLIFGIINIVGNFGTVFVDQSYWQSAIAAQPSSAHKGYLLGGLVWFTIPFALATSMGLAATALQLPITSAEAGAGLVPPAVATHMYGEGGALMISIMLFMAIVSTGSAESIAVSSLCSYDIYRKYFNPEATGKQILRVSQVVIFIFCLIMGFLACALKWMDISLGWVYLFMGIMIGSAVIPLWNMMMWDKASGTGAVVAAWTGQFCAIGSWMIAAQVYYGEVTVDTLGGNYPMLSGNLVAILLSGLIHFCWSMMWPQNYDWQSMKEIKLVEDDRSGLDARLYDPEQLQEAYKWITTRGWGLSFVLIIVWPVLSLCAGVFTKDYFAFWVFISIAWGFVAAVVIIGLPIYESTDQIAKVLSGVTGHDFVTTWGSKAAVRDMSAAVTVNPMATTAEGKDSKVDCEKGDTTIAPIVASGA